MTNKSVRRRILFVDDEPHILEGLQNMLRKMRDTWDMAFVESGQKALDLMQLKPVDIIVSDMRMPGMDGVQLLNLVRSMYPGTVRFILSGHSDRESVLRSVGPTHQFISKPCSADEMKAAVGRAFALRDLLGMENLRKLVLDVKSLPTIPTLYTQICAALNSGRTSMSDVGTLISKDMVMSAKILQLVNSAFFGLRRRIGSLDQAVSLLGLDTIKAVVMATGVFHTFSSDEMKEFAVEELYAHSTLVGGAAGRIGKRILHDQKMIDETTMAGMMHDLGQVVLIKNHPGILRQILKEMRDSQRSRCDVEQELLGTTHAEIGAYVLGVWGLSDSIVEATAFHHNPSACFNHLPSVLCAVHLADGLSGLDDNAVSGDSAESVILGLDREYLQTVGLENQLKELAIQARPLQTSEGG